uniref:Uncharacterized protein n=1 Tax=Arundo donax TaxID=35708 RepID=A0A0A9HQ46_ARUDO
MQICTLEIFWSVLYSQRTQITPL